MFSVVLLTKFFRLLLSLIQSADFTESRQIHLVCLAALVNRYIIEFARNLGVAILVTVSANQLYL